MSDATTPHHLLLSEHYSEEPQTIVLLPNTGEEAAKGGVMIEQIRVASLDMQIAVRETADLY